MMPDRLFELVSCQLNESPQKVCLAAWGPEGVKAWSTSELLGKIDRYASLLVHWGLQPGQIVVLSSISSTPAEVAIEMAIIKCGAILCPLSNYLADDELGAILQELEPSMIFCQGPALLERFKRHHTQDENRVPGSCIYHLFEAFETGEEPEKDSPFPEVDPQACALIMYTSGSYGKPKGVMLSHQNILSNVEGLLECMPIRAGHRVMSYLSRSHIMERTATYSYITAGASVYFVPSPNQLQEAIRQIKPRWMTSVPLILERLHSRIVKQVERGGWVGRLIFSSSERSGFMRLLVKIFMINAWKRKYGSGLKGVIVGGAAMSPEIARLFSTSGIRIREGYGLTETSPAITFNRYRKKDNRFGTAGIILRDISVRIQNPNPDTETGEIEVKGPNVMIGYFRDEKATRERFTKDGWFRTGDLGRLVDGRFLQITDRISNVYKNASGRFVIPGPLEQKLVSFPAVEQAIVYGLNRPYNVALIIPDFLWLRSWAEGEQVHWTDSAYMIHNPRVEELYDAILSEVNKTSKPHERIRRHVLGKEKWTRENSLLSLTMKPRRKLIIEAFSKRIEEVYDSPGN